MTQSRREFVKASGLAFAGFAVLPSRRLFSPAALEKIEMRSDALGSRVWFDPIGLHVEPGTTVRWIVRENVHTTTAYHPRNDHHSLRSLSTRRLGTRGSSCVRALISTSG